MTLLTEGISPERKGGFSFFAVHCFSRWKMVFHNLGRGIMQLIAKVIACVKGFFFSSTTQSSAQAPPSPSDTSSSTSEEQDTGLTSEDLLPAPSRTQKKRGLTREDFTLHRRSRSHDRPPSGVRSLSSEEWETLIEEWKIREKAQSSTWPPRSCPNHFAESAAQSPEI